MKYIVKGTHTYNLANVEEIYCDYDYLMISINDRQVRVTFGSANDIKELYYRLLNFLQTDEVIFDIEKTLTKITNENE